MRPGQVKTVQVKTGQVKTGLFRASQVNIICQLATGHVWTSQVGDRSIQVMTASVQSRWVKSIWNFSDFLPHKVIFTQNLFKPNIFWTKNFFVPKIFWKFMIVSQYQNCANTSETCIFVASLGPNLQFQLELKSCLP